MQRRTFVKAQGRQKQDFVIYFIGDYGKGVWEQFKCLKRQYPIFNKCRHAAGDIHSNEGFILVSDNHDLEGLFARSCNCEMACFVMDARKRESVQFAEIICRLLKGSEEAILLCLSPVIPEAIRKDLFNLAVGTFSTGQDLSACLLLTLYNAYMGCGGMGNIQCLRFILDAMELQNNHFQATVGMAIQKGPLESIHSGNLVMEALRYIQGLPGEPKTGFLCGILEMSTSEERVLGCGGQVFNLGIIRLPGTRSASSVSRKR